MQAEWFWAVIVDHDPHFGSTGKRRYPRHKRRETFLWAKVDVYAGPRVMATDQARCFGGMSTACSNRVRLVGGRSCVWAALR